VEKDPELAELTEQFELAEQFERQRPRLHAVAVRLLGSAAEADDAVQDAWLRASRADRSDVVNLGGWLTTIVARVCLTVLQTRRTRPERALDEDVHPPVADSDPERDALLAETVGQALLVVLDTLAPAERLAFVLHDVFAVPFDEVAGVLDRTPVATRQLASRARRRLAGAGAGQATDQARAEGVVRAFLLASRTGEFTDLLTVLDPDVVLRADPVAVRSAAAAVAQGAPALAPEVRGAAAVAHAFSGRAQAAQPALVDGLPGLIWAPGGEVRVVFDMVVHDDRIVAVEMLADPDLVRELEIELL
jgi:RNA polymerase sigma factor (sigma-70 family)